MRSIQYVHRVLRFGLFITSLTVTLGLPSLSFSSQSNTIDSDYGRGARLWANTCNHCHNMRGTDEFRPDQWRAIMAHMRIRAGLTGQDAHDILNFITGDIGEFADHGPALTAAVSVRSQATTTKKLTTDKQKLVSTKKTLVTIAKKPTKRNVTIKRSGAAIYKKNCTVCHGSNGKGVIPGTPDLTKKNGVLSKQYSTLLFNIKHGIRAMPAKGGNPNLTDAQLKAVLDYMIATFK